MALNYLSLLVTTLILHTHAELAAEGSHKNLSFQFESSSGQQNLFKLRHFPPNRMGNGKFIYNGVGDRTSDPRYSVIVHQNGTCQFTISNVAFSDAGHYELQSQATSHDTQNFTVFTNASCNIDAKAEFVVCSIAFAGPSPPWFKLGELGDCTESHKNISDDVRLVNCTAAIDGLKNLPQTCSMSFDGPNEVIQVNCTSASDSGVDESKPATIPDDMFTSMSPTRHPSSSQSSTKSGEAAASLDVLQEMLPLMPNLLIEMRSVVSTTQSNNNYLLILLIIVVCLLILVVVALVGIFVIGYQIYLQNKGFQRQDGSKNVDHMTQTENNSANRHSKERMDTDTNDKDETATLLGSPVQDDEDIDMQNPPTLTTIAETSC